MLFSWFVASRFRRGRKQNGFISFVSSSSTLGIGLGCYVLIVLLSVMNGFESQLRISLLSKIPHAELLDASGNGIRVSNEWLETKQKDYRVSDILKVNKASGLLQKVGQMKAIELIGISDDYASAKLPDLIDLSELRKYANPVNSATDKSRSVPIILGTGILENLNLKRGDKVQLLLPNVTKDLSFRSPKVVNLIVAGSVSLGGELDSFIGVMDRETLGSILGFKDSVSAVEFKLNDPFDGYQFIRDVGYQFDQAVYMSDWTRTQGHLYQDIQLVRVVVYIALALVICVACFNIVSSLVMLVKEKQAEVAILKTMGASERSIKGIFILQGLVNGLIGASFGAVLAVITALNLSDWVAYMQEVFGFTLLEGGIYFVDFLPTQLKWVDVLATYTIAILLSLIATLYPAKQAAEVQPAVALKS